MSSALYVLLLPLITGILLILSLPDACIWPLAFVAHVPLFLSVTHLNPTRAFLAGWFSGVVAYAGIFHWIAHTAMTMSDFPLAAAIGVVLAYALFNGISVGLLALFARSSVPVPVLTIPAAAVVIEWLWPNLFPWYLGNAFYKVPLLMQGMDLTGVRGGTFIAVMFSSCVIHKRFPSFLIASLVLAAWLAYGGFRLHSWRTAGYEKSIHLALVQPDITAMDKKRKDIANRKALLSRLMELTRSTDLSTVDAIVWPEGAFPFYFAPNEVGRKGYEHIVEASNKLISFVKEISKPLIFGTQTEVNGRARNSAIMLSENGEEIARYDKRKLLAFGEYMPLSDKIPWLKHRIKEVGDMASGDKAIAFEVRGVRGAISICYEAILDSFTRDTVNETNADYLLNLTNDGWFGESGAPEQHLMVQVARAVELRLPLVRVTETGITAVVMPSGDFLLKTSLHERRVDTVELNVKTDLSSPYRKVGDIFSWLCALLVVALFGRRAFEKMRHYLMGKKLRSTITG